MAERKRRTQADRREAAESRLVDAAVNLVAERGYDGFTLSDVGHAAGYSRGLPAHYFGRKEDLLALVAQHAIELYLKSVAELDLKDPGLPTIVAFVRKYLASRDKTSLALNLIIAEATVRPELRETISRNNARGIRNIEAQLLAGIDAGNIRPDVDVHAQARVIYAFLRGQLSFTALDPGIDTDAVGDEFLAMLTCRIAADR